MTSALAPIHLSSLSGPKATLKAARGSVQENAPWRLGFFGLASVGHHAMPPGFSPRSLKSETVGGLLGSVRFGLGFSTLQPFFGPVPPRAIVGLCREGKNQRARKICPAAWRGVRRSPTQKNPAATARSLARTHARLLGSPLDSTARRDVWVPTPTSFGRHGKRLVNRTSTEPPPIWTATPRSSSPSPSPGAGRIVVPTASRRWWASF